MMLGGLSSCLFDASHEWCFVVVCYPSVIADRFVLLTYSGCLWFVVSRVAQTRSVLCPHLFFFTRLCCVVIERTRRCLSIHAMGRPRRLWSSAARRPMTWCGLAVTLQVCSIVGLFVSVVLCLIDCLFVCCWVLFALLFVASERFIVLSRAVVAHKFVVRSFALCILYVQSCVLRQ